ncbi:DUF6215 domain-containing protein [Streptomyces sp. NPDC127092]|uniref:DUF6215 domain-containing protein n=1 Tax=Streptomyces sp. NPDC127092 TaxID=3347135 RepID=UPI003659B793
MTEQVAAEAKGPRAGAQATAALVLGAVLAGGFWYLAQNEQESAAARGPAECRASTGKLPATYVNGTRLCQALNRPDLPTLLGTPGEQAQNAWGNDGEDPTGGRAPRPEGQVGLPTYSVQLSLSYDRMPVARLGRLLGGTEPTTFQGRAAFLYSDRTLALKIPLGGGKAESGTGGIARHLVVARDAEDGGGSYELVIWREDQGIPDDAALLRVAERVLPTVPGWAGN